MNCEECGKEIRSDKYKVQQTAPGVFVGGIAMHPKCDDCANKKMTVKKPEERKQLGSQYDHGLKDMWDEWNEYHNQVLEEGILTEDEIIQACRDVGEKQLQAIIKTEKDIGLMNMDWKDIDENGGKIEFDDFAKAIYKAQMEKINKGR